MGIMARPTTRVLCFFDASSDAARSLGRMRAAGTDVVAAVSPGGAAPTCDLPAYDTAAQAVGDRGANAALVALSPDAAADAMMESIELLANVSRIFVDKLLAGLEVNADRCAQLIEQSLMMVTSLAPELGYDQAAKIAKQALAEGKTIRELVTEQRPRQLTEKQVQDTSYELE